MREIQREDIADMSKISVNSIFGVGIEESTVYYGLKECKSIIGKLIEMAYAKALEDSKAIIPKDVKLGELTEISNYSYAIEGGPQAYELVRLNTLLGKDVGPFDQSGQSQHPLGH